MTERHRLRRTVAGAGLLALATTLLTVAPAQAAPDDGCAKRSNNSVEKLLECVQGGGVAKRLAALQGIADANGGTRASGTPGYAASVAYVVAEARKAGLTVATQDFTFPFFQENSASLAQIAPTPTTYVEGTDFATMTFSGAGDVTGTAVPVDLLLPPTGGSTSGCEATDFANFPAGQVALIQRGTCTFGAKAANAAAAGAKAVIIFNEGNSPDREPVLQGTLGAPVAIPVVGTSFAVGTSLQNATVRVAVDAISENRTTTNVTAEIKGSRNPDQVLMVGSHLDSVIAGPGINDNGSGSATNLEVATLMAKSKPASTVRFAWWGAEELGLLGSENYVTTLPAAELARITGYLNFDMLASPNFARFVYDGDNSDAVGAGPGPDGSAAIEKVFEAFYDARGLAHEGTDFDGRSDYGPFIDAGIPAGGLFSGAEGIKSPEQQARYGGTAGVAYDSCYHQACDTVTNISATSLDQSADAVAYATFTLAGTKKSVKPVKSATKKAVAGEHHDSAS
jgi:Zn-dependent M28 family amino/carboxypeptidase